LECQSCFGPGITAGIPRGMIKNCKGIILLSVVEAGFIFSGNVGTGVIIANKYDGTWSPPSALGLGGIGWGFMVGAEVKVSVLSHTYCILVILTSTSTYFNI